MKKLTDLSICEVEIAFRACHLRWPYRIGNIVIEAFPIAMAKIAIELGDGRWATGYGSTPSASAGPGRMPDLTGASARRG